MSAGRGPAKGEGRPSRALPLPLVRISRLVRKELRQIFRDPRTKRIIFASPIIQLLAFGYAVNTDVRNTATFVQDHDRTTESRELIGSLTAAGYFRVVGTSTRDHDLTDALDHGRAVIGVVVPAGFARDVRAGRAATVQVLVDGTNSNTGTVAQGNATRTIAEWGIARARGRGPEPSVTGAAPGVDLRVRAWFNPDLVSRVYNVPAVIGLIVLLMSMLLTSLGVVREREVGTLDQLLVSPLSAGELMLGKTLPVAGIAMAQLALVTTVGLLWFRIPFRGDPLVLLVAAVAFILAGLSLGLIISTISATQQEAFLGMFLVVFPVIILSGFLYPVDTMPYVFERLSLANPLRHFLEIVRAVFLKGAGFTDLWTQFVTLTGMAAAGLLYATRRFARSMA